MTHRTIGFLAGCYLLLLFFPNPLFAYSTRVGPFRIHSDRPLPREIDRVVDRALKQLEGSPFYESEDRFHLYLANDSWRRRLLNPRASGAFAAAFVFTGNTILNRTDIPADTCFNDLERHSERPLHQVIAHECTHHLLARKLGWMAYVRLPTWKNEGYCEHVAGSSTFPEEKGVELLKAGRSASAPAFRYLTYRLATTYQLEQQGITHDAFFETDLDLQGSIDSCIATK